MEKRGKDRRIIMKKILLSMIVAQLGMIFCLAGCSAGGNKLKDGTYSGSSEGTKGVISSTFVFEKDGTCTYEYVYTTYYGTKEHTDSYAGVWSKSDDDTYEIMLNGISDILYAKVLDSGDIVVSSDGSGWATETFSKE